MGLLNTFFAWRGATHGKRGVAATNRVVDHMRRRELLNHGLIEFNATDAEVSAVEASLARQRHDAVRARQGSLRATFGGEPMESWRWWTLAVFSFAASLTGIGLVVTIPLGVVLWLRHPWQTVAASSGELDPPTQPLPTVPDPVGVHTLPPRPGGRHAR